MKVLVGSDYHGSDRLQAEAIALLSEVDWYVNCGDFCSRAGKQPQATQLGCHPDGLKEVEQLERFLRAVDESGTPWLFVPGNHEPPASTLGELNRKLDSSTGHIATETQLVSIQGKQVLIVPLTPPCGWCWVLSKDDVKAIAATYQDASVDLLITHAPPRGCLDEESKWYKGQTPTLAPAIAACHPTYYFCGHMHHDGGRQAQMGETTVVNAALHNTIVEI
ncbi:MAG: metallophosphoesterase family protein [Cyanobacteria bacterium J06639_1]